MKRIDFTNKTTPSSGNPINSQNLNEIQVIFDNAGNHNSIFRGKDVTSYYDDGSLWTRISNGKFEDLFVGDYIVKNGINWRIAGFDIGLHNGDTEMKNHHAIIVPDTNLTNAQMNTTNTTNGGYIGSNMYKNILSSVFTTYINSTFGNHVIEHRNLLTNSINLTGYNRYGTNNGCTSGWDWYSRKIDLLNEVQVLGTIAWSSSGYEIGNDNCQLPLFRLAPEFICNRSWYWLRNIATSSLFVCISGNGLSSGSDASNSGGIRPYFYID